MKIIFLGTPDFSLPTLRALHESKHEILAVITQPDREGNRRKMTPPPVKVMAEEFGLPVMQYQSLRKEGEDYIRSLSPDLLVTAAFGQIISREILAIPRYGTLNVHGSLLPKYRGASPIQQCLLNGDTETGVTIMRTEYEIDSGDIVLQKSFDILPTDNAGTLFARISELGAAALVEAVDMIENGTAKFVAQNHENATFCKMIAKQDGELKSDLSVNQALCKIRAYNPWPVAYVMIGGSRLRIFEGTIVSKNAEAGIIKAQNGHLMLNFIDGAIDATIVQGEGGKVMQTAAYLLGHNIDGEKIDG